MSEISLAHGDCFETSGHAAIEYNEILTEAGEDHSVYRDAAKTAWSFVRRALYYINGFENKLLAWDCWLFVMKEFELLQYLDKEKKLQIVENETDLARKHRCTKANISKTVKKIEREFGMQSILREGVNNMRESRKGQLK
jgi:hypothetical protein